MECIVACMHVSFFFYAIEIVHATVCTRSEQHLLNYSSSNGDEGGGHRSITPVEVYARPSYRYPHAVALPRTLNVSGWMQRERKRWREGGRRESHNNVLSTEKLECGKCQSFNESWGERQLHFPENREITKQAKNSEFFLHF